ncbi:MAG TPA: glycosyltransferase [Bacteroidota bacterium]|nr:glycosyltransferase [Bacteroidota bacterium]
MNILLLGTAYPWRGGIAHYVALLAKHMQKEQHHVDVVTFRRQYPALLFPGKTQNETGDLGIILPTESLMDSINPFNWIRVGLKLRKRNPDAVIFKYWLPFFGPCFGTICRMVKFHRKTKIIAICDNVLPHEHRPGDKIFTRYAFGVVDGYIVQSDSVEKDLTKLIAHPQYKKVAHPIYEIFGEPLSKQAARERLRLTEEHIILFFGYVRRYKGLDVLLEAMKLVQHRQKIKLMVVGEFYDDEHSYREQAEKLELHDTVQFVSEYVSNDHVAEYFSAADCVVLPYRSATQSGIVQIAYNFNKPVIVTRVGGLAEIVPDGIAGFTVPPENPQALAEAILKFYRENCEQQFSTAVQHEKQKYSWDHVVHAIEQLIDPLNEKTANNAAAQ